MYINNVADVIATEMTDWQVAPCNSVTRLVNFTGLK